jgi:hypothetical protein
MIYCLTRRDYEGDKLHDLVDTVIGVFTDTSTTDTKYKLLTVSTVSFKPQ